MKTSLLSKLERPFFVLAPMDDVTDTVFRRVVGQCAAPDLYFTEFVNVDGLQSPGRPKLLKKLRLTDDEHPIIAQIWGKEPENFYKTAIDLVKMGYDGVDLNFGCPAVAGNGACIGMINNRELVGQIIEATKKGIEQGAVEKGIAPLPLSVKTRLGLREIDYTWHEFLLKHKLNMLTIHGRTAKEMSKVPVHWDSVEHIRKMRDQLSPDTLFVGNGDILSRPEGEALAKQYGLDGVMIGRGVFHDPFVFSKSSPWLGLDKQQRIELYKNQITLFAETWQNGERPVPTLNKFCKIYINGFDGAKELREQLMACNTTDELMQRLLASD